MKRRDGIVNVLDGEKYTPYGLARKLSAKVILESSSIERGRARYSLIMVREAFRLIQRGGTIHIEVDGKRKRIKGNGKDILDYLPYFANQHPVFEKDIPVPAGGIGYLSYEFAGNCDNIRFRRKEDEIGLPLGAFLFGHVFIVFDHYTDRIYLIGLNYREHEIDLENAIKAAERRIHDLDFNYLSREEEQHSVEILDGEDERIVFLDGVKRIKDEIIKGNLLQGVLSRRMKIKTELPAFAAYKLLRSTNPSPYLFYLDFGEYQLFGSSPEVHIKVSDGKVLIRPLAGTRRRGTNMEEDISLERELLADEKEKAEHLMLVDLARNDLGRFCVAGSVKVTDFMGIERFSHLMHIVSQVEGELSPEKSGIEAIRATFPAGTVSGAPKIRSIEVVDNLERYTRGFYAGLVGYLGSDGNLDTCITIRSAIKKGDELYLQAGAGVVYDSVPEREYEETGEKLRALAAAVGVEI